jgi:hypothetical protein
MRPPDWQTRTAWKLIAGRGNAVSGFLALSAGTKSFGSTGADGEFDAVAGARIGRRAREGLRF